MTEQDWLAGQFEQSRPHLQAVAYSMLGTVSEAQDAVQEAWLRLDRSRAIRATGRARRCDGHRASDVWN